MPELELKTSTTRVLV